MDELLPRITWEMSPSEALTFILDWLETDPDDGRLCAAALTMLEPLIDWHWKDVVDEFEQVLMMRADLRKMLSCCMLDQAVPDEVQDRLYAHVQPEDDIGHQPQGRGPH